MNQGWRGATQRVLHKAIDLLEKRPIKRWTKDNQRIGIAVGITIFAISAVWLSFIGWLVSHITPAPECVTPECYQAVWQGRWALWSVLLSALSLIATVGSIFLIWKSLQANRDVQKQEFKAYLTASVTKLLIDNNGEMIFNVEVENYGRTPASSVNISYEIDILHPLLELNKHSQHEVLGFEPLIHPGKKLTIAGNETAILMQTYLGLLQSDVTILMTGEISYTDVFGDIHAVSVESILESDQVECGKVGDLIDD